MSKNVDFIFDFASPNAYMTHKAVAGIKQRTGATFNYIPCLLGGIFKSTGNQAPFVTFANVKGKQEYNKLENERFIAKHQLTAYKMNPHFPMSTVALMRGLIVAEEAGQKGPYTETVLKAMWEEGENMADNDVAIRVLTAAGLDGQSNHRENAGPRHQGQADRQHQCRRRSRRLWHSDILRWRRDVFRQGASRPSRRRNPERVAQRLGARVELHRPQ